MKRLLFALLVSCAAGAFAEVDKDALPDVEDGFEINFFVKEPHIINPSSLCFDKHGRLYVGAGPQYRHPKEDSPTDYIKILIDADDDGVAETVKIFAEGFNCVEAMAWKGDELWVANAPELTVVRDTDGDDVADEYQVIYTGLNNLRHSVHGLNWGPDGWLYFSMGNTWVKPNAPKPIRDLQGIKSDDKTEYPLSKVYTKDTYPKTYHPMNKSEKEGGIFRCRPGGHGLELWARGMRNPWDICMDSGFNWLGTDNDPGPPGDRIFMPIRHGHYSMRHPWKFDWMGTHIAVAPSSDLFPGVSGSGTGVAFYTSKHFPEQYRNRYLIADWTNNCIFLYEPKWDGALQVPAVKKRKIVDGGVTQAGDLGYKGAKGRSLFRPTDIEVGPDGALYIGGWGSVYGTKYVPKDKWTAEENAKYEGRVFRLRHTDPLISRASWDTAKRKKDIATWNFDELMADLGSAVHVWRVNAQDEFVRRGTKVRGELLKAIQSGTLTDTQATWGIWALGHIEKASGGDHPVFKQMSGWPNLNIAIQATRILGENQRMDAVPLLIQLLGSPEPRIRTAAMQSLDRIGWGEHGKAIVDAVAFENERVSYYTNWQVMRRQLPESQRRELLTDERPGIRRMAALGLMEDGDRELQKRANEFLGGGVAEGGAPSTDLKLSASEVHFRGSTKVRFASATKGTIYYSLDGADPTPKSAQSKGEITVSKDATIKAAVFNDGRRVSAVERLTVHKITDSEWADRLFVRGIRGRGAASSYLAELEGLQRGTLVYADRNYTYTGIPEALAGATHIRTHNDDKKGADAEFLRFEINLPATLYLAYDDRSKAPGPLIAGMEKTDMKLRISSRGESFDIYRRAVEAGEVVLGGNKVGGSGGESMYQVFLSKAGSSKTTLAAAQAALGKANAKHGEEIFFGRGTCFACHKVGDRGIAIGPDLAGIGKRRDMNYVIQSTLEPDAYIVEGFQQASLDMKDGRRLFGMIHEETGQSLKLVLPTGEQLELEAGEVKKRADAKNSLMPASFAYTLSAQDVADVSAWIMALEAPATSGQGAAVEHRAGEKKVVVTLGGTPFTEYRYGNAGKPILYPVIGPHGIAMTRHYPMKKNVAGEADDHPHHQSLYYVHPINGVDFWHGRGGANIRNDKITRAEMEGGQAVIVSRNSWRKGDQVLCTDTTEIRAGATEGGRFIDYRITLHASHGAFTFDETKEGTMAIRTHPALRLQGKVARGSAVNSEGVTGKDVWGKAASWVDYWGPIDGKTVGIAIFDHPTNPRHPTTWHARDYGLITANPFGGRYFKSKQGALTVEKGESITFSYRFFFHEGGHEEANILKHYNAWAK